MKTFLALTMLLSSAAHAAVTVTLVDRDSCTISDGVVTLYFSALTIWNKPYCDGQMAIDAYLKLSNKTLQKNAKEIAEGTLTCTFNSPEQEEPVCEPTKKARS